MRAHVSPLVCQLVFFHDMVGVASQNNGALFEQVYAKMPAEVQQCFQQLIEAGAQAKQATPGEC